MKAVAGSDIKPGMWVQLTPGDDAFRVSRVGPLANAETWLKVFNEDGFPCAVRRDAWYAEVGS